MLHTLGSEVTLLVRGDGVLRPFDATIREQLLERLREDGINVLTRTQIRAVAQLVGGSLDLHCEGRAGALNVDTLLWAIGRTPNTDQLNLAAASVRDEPGRHDSPPIPIKPPTSPTFTPWATSPSAFI
jgi:glutathione reductase (NADPH)